MLNQLGNSSKAILFRSVGIIAVTIFITALSLFSPPLAFFTVFGFLAIIIRSSSLHSIFLLLAALSIFLPLNLSKIPYNDWEWYTSHYIWLQHINFLDYLGSKFGPFSIKTTEPVYYFLASILSRVSSGNVGVLAGSVTAIIYGSVSLLTGWVFRHLEQVPIRRYLLEWSVILICVTFTLTLHLVRQQVGGAFLVLALFAFFQRNNLWAFILGVLACLTHNALIVPFVLFMLVFFLVNRASANWMILRVLTLGAATGLLVLFLAVALNFYASGHSDGEVSLFVILFDIFLGCAFGLYYISRGLGNDDRMRVFALFALGYAVFLFFMLPLPIPFLRMYFVVEYIRIVLLATLLGAFAMRVSYILLAPLIVGLAVVGFFLRLDRTPFQFGEGFLVEIVFPDWAPLGGYSEMLGHVILR